MKPAIAALTAALLMAGAASAQVPGATENTGAVAAEPAPAGQVGIQPSVSPELRKKLLRGLLQAITQPRPAAAAPAAPAEPLVTTQPAAGTPVAAPVDPSPSPPSPAAPVPVPPAGTVTAPPPAVSPAPHHAAETHPRPTVEPAVATPAPRPGPRPAPPAHIEPAPAPPPAAVDEPAPAPALEPAKPSSAPIAEPTRAILGTGTWLLLGLLAAAAAAAAAAMHWLRMRRIARTRAALALKPRIDLSAGASSIRGLSLVSPPLAIRARLAMPGASGG